MDAAWFEEIAHSLKTDGADAAIEKLCCGLRERKEFSALFYAMLLKKRHELGISPVPSGPSSEIPSACEAPYEQAIRDAGRLVGGLLLEQGDIPHAWVYFRMLGENQPVANAIEQARPAEGDDVQQLVDIAYHQGVHPRRGFDLLLERYGLCSAITAAGSGDPPQPPEVRTYCTQRLVRALYKELGERLTAEITRKEGTAPTERSVRELMKERDWLFEDDFYHVDISHLASVTQMSLNLERGEELSMVREMAEYGKRLSPRYQSGGEPPFENQYHDYAIYLAILAGENVEAGLAHFQAKIDQADPEEIGTGPAEVLVNLLLRLERPAEALAIARRHFAGSDSQRLSCPGITELCQKANDYRALSEVAQEQGDAVHFLAGLLASLSVK